MFNFRQKLLTFFLFVSIFICVMAYSSGYWQHWSLLAISIFFWLLCDILFFDDQQFLFEPDFRVWAEKNK